MPYRVRHFSLVAASCVLAAALAGCAAKPDLAKVTYERTTVPAGAGGNTASTGTPKTNDAAFSSETLRQIDPCKLLDKDTLSALGTPADSTSSDFSGCSNFMKDKDGKDLNVTVTLGEGLLENPNQADKNIGGLPAIEQELDDHSACFQTVVTETSPNRGIKVQIGGKADNKCEVGRTVLEAVVNRIRTDPPKLSPKAGSLIGIDPCTTIGDAELTAALGAAPKPVPTNLHWCTWTESGADIWAWFRYGVDPKKVADPKKTTKIDLSGIEAYQTLETTSSAKCAIEWTHKPLADDFAEVVSIDFLRYDPKQGEDVCAKALTAAKAVVAKLPKR